MKLDILSIVLISISNAIYCYTSVVHLDDVKQERQVIGPVAEADVIILGAGIAGISAARQLILEHNITDVLLIEARDVVGGRAYSEYLTDPNTGRQTAIEKGCNWIQGYGHDNVTALANKWGLATQSQNYSSLVWFNGTRGLDSADAAIAPGRFLTNEEVTFQTTYDDAAAKIPEYLAQRTGLSLVDITVRAALSILGFLPKTPLEKLYEWYNIDYTFAQEPEVCSFYNIFAVPEDAAQDRLVIDQRGYRYIFESELKETFNGTLEDKRLYLNTTVKDIDYSQGGPVYVTTDKGLFIAKKHVIATFSIGVLQDNMVTWTPQLPAWKKEAIYSFAMALYVKVFLLFPTQFWRDEELQAYADPYVRGRYPLWQNLNAPGFLNGSENGYIYFMTQIGDEAKRVSAMSDEDVQSELMFKLKEMYGDDIPEPLDIFVPRWDQDPLFRGSYSNWPLGELDQHHFNLGQSLGNNSVFFAGEAYSEEAFGYVQGAMENGKQVASTVAACIKDGNCPQSFAYEAISTCAQSSTLLKRKNLLQRRHL